MTLAKEKILVALDVPTIKQALILVEELKEYVGGFKVGLELCISEGVPAVVSTISKAGGRVFLDLKLKDIPNTVSSAVKVAIQEGVLLLTIHCDGGIEMMKAAAKVAKAVPAPRTLIVGVTVLTSISQQTLTDELHIANNVGDYVCHLAHLAQTSGLDGVVCSPQEVAQIKKTCGAEFLTVVPGIRPNWADTADQKRIMTPAEAIIAGADYMVIGRPITKPPAKIGSPSQAAKLISDEIEALCR